MLSEASVLAATAFRTLAADSGTKTLKASWKKPDLLSSMARTSSPVFRRLSKLQGPRLCFKRPSDVQSRPLLWSERTQ